MNAVEVNGIALTYGGKKILSDLSLQVRGGEFFVIIGPNGAGKTTLLKIIAGLEKPAAGTITVFDRPLESYSRRQLSQKVALVPQYVPIDFPFTVMETVLMGRSPHLPLVGMEQQRDFDIAVEAMQFTDSVHLADRRLDQLSGGERQRIIIARAICQDPSLILLDEPTAALDPAHQIKIMDLMERLRSERDITVIMVSHDLNLAAMYGDRLLLLKDGCPVISGTPYEVLTEEILMASYGCTMQVDQHRLGRVPRVTPVPEKYLHTVRREE